MADEDKEKAEKKVKKKVAKKKASKKKVAKKKVASKKKAVKKVAPKKAASSVAKGAKPVVNAEKAGAASADTKPAPVSTSSTVAPGSASTTPDPVSERKAPAPSKSTSSAKPATEDSAAWWLNLALVIVIAAIAALLYVMMQFGELKGMNMDQIWSYFSTTPAAATSEPAHQAQAPVAEVLEVVVEKEVILTMPAPPATEPEAELRPLPQDQQELLWEALLAPSQSP
ncbi:hypothetical protein [Thiolapillus sp.]